ncbi:hypothetical protein ACFZAG_15040 [Streptomyces sp. NPDC012403]
MDIYYAVGPEKIGNGAQNMPTRTLWRQEALSLSQAGRWGGSHCKKPSP